MIVTCSNCEARYAVDPLAIGPGGRTVQCARCNHRWFQKVEGPKPAPDLVIRPPAHSVSLPVPVVAKPKPVWGKRAAITGIVVILLGAAGAGAYVYQDELVVYRDKIVARLPGDVQSSQPSSSSSTPVRAPAPASAETNTAPAAPIATESSAATAPPAAAPAPRLDPPPVPAQLEVDLSASKIELIDGRYVVRGEIANHGGTAGSTSKLVVTFKKGNDVLGVRTYMLTLGPIAAGDRMTFSQTLENPPAGATDIVPSVE